MLGRTSFTRQNSVQSPVMVLDDVRKRLEQLGWLNSDDVLKPASDWSGGESRPALHPPDLSLETLIPGVADETDITTSSI